MMRMIAILLCGVLAACSQTGSSHNGSSQTASTAPSSQAARPSTKTSKPNARQVASRDDCQDAVAKVQQQQMNSAMLGGALSMVGGLGGFAGRGGAVAAQAVSVGGSVAQAHARNSAQSTIREECFS